MASFERKKDTCWKPKIQILAGSGEFFLFQEKCGNASLLSHDFRNFTSLGE